MNKYRFLEDKHLHQLNVDREWKNLSGTSTISGVLPKELTYWASELSAVECLESGIHIPTIRQEYEEVCNSGNKSYYMKKLQEKYPIFRQARFAHKENNKKTQKSGIDLHACLEEFIKDCISGNYPESAGRYDERIHPFINWSNENVKKWLGSEFHVYSEELWCGGIVDGLALLNDGTIAIIDFKSAKEAYINHFVQVAGYCIQLEENGMFDCEGNNCSCKEILFENNILNKTKSVDNIIIFPFGAKELKPHYNKQPIDCYKEMFKACNTIYRYMGNEGLNDKNRIINKKSSLK